jgi:hypothetical protein
MKREGWGTRSVLPGYTTTKRHFVLQLVLAVAAFDGVEEFGGVVAYAVFEDDFDFFDVVDVGGRVAVDDDEVGVFAGGDGADG